MISALLLAGRGLSIGSQPAKAASSGQVEAKIVNRGEQRYMAIRTQVPMSGLNMVIPNGLREVFTWIGMHGGRPAGPPFTRYRVIDMAKKLDVEVGVPVANVVPGGSRVHSGSFPAGRYVVYTFTGNYSGLEGANASTQAWAQKRGIKLDRKDSKSGIVWGGRAEYYLTDPSTQRDPSKWQTQIVYLLKH